MVRGGDDGTAGPGVQSVIFLDEHTGELCLRLRRRKNRPQGSLLKRVCCCKGSIEICPVHILWESFFKRMEPGCAPWAHVSATLARTRLRESLHALQVSGSCSQRSCCACAVCDRFRVPTLMVPMTSAGVMPRRVVHFLFACVLAWVASVNVGPAREWCTTGGHSRRWRMARQVGCTVLGSQ